LRSTHVACLKCQKKAAQNVRSRSHTCRIVRIHLRGDDGAVLRAADTLMAGARSVGGSARVERRDDALRDRLASWGPAPGGDFLMRRIREAFDPARTLEPARSIVR